jgi:two-component system phosphate regulon sensor histidine kinase PhoR
MRLRVGQRLFLSYLLLISTLVVSLSAGAEWLLRRHLQGLVLRELHAELSLGAAYYDAASGISPDSVANLLGALSRHRFTIIRPDGRVVGESTRDGPALAAMAGHADRPEVRAALAGGRGQAVRFSETADAELMYVAAPSRRGDVVRASLPLASVDQAVAGVQRGIYGVGAVALLLATLFSLGFSVAFTRPLLRVKAAATALAAGHLHVRLRERSGDELGDLARALDTLAEELQHRLLQLEGERAETQALIDSMSEGVLALDPDGLLRRANPAARRMFALPARAQGIPPEAVARRPGFLRLVRRALAGETVRPTELTGDSLSILATGHPLPDGGAVLVFLDVSELRRLEGVRRDFVANASHELKTPLTAIRGYSETLLDPDLPPELARRFAEIVKANADRLQRIVDDLLDLSRLESGGWTAEPEPVDLREFAEEAWEAQPRTGEPKQIRFAVELSPGAERVCADSAALQQIFTNLFSNAVRYTPSGGAITVRAERLATAPGSPAEPEEWVRVEVRDTGSGIPSIHLPRIFERFYRVDPARAREEGGTGLGLAIVKHLVEAHGGQVQAESAMGRGTVIRLTLPADPE